VALTLPAGWSVAPPRQFTPGSLTFVTSLKTMALRFSIQPLGIADTRSPADPIAAAAAGVAALTHGLTTRARNFPVTVAGLPAVMLLDMALAHIPCSRCEDELNHLDAQNEALMPMSAVSESRSRE